MKITIWIRPNAKDEPTLRLDAKNESRDTPLVQRFGNKLIKAIESGGEKE